jgi:hypothetical protein
MDWLEIQALRQWAYLVVLCLAGVYFAVAIVKDICYLWDWLAQRRIEREWTNRINKEARGGEVPNR